METRSARARRFHRVLTTELEDLQRLERSAQASFASILREKLYKELGYASIHAYGRDALGFSERKLSAFVRMAEAMERLPETRRAVDAGELPWTKARELVSVATPENEGRWLAEAKALGRRDLERKVRASRARPPRRRKDPPALGFEPTEQQERRTEAEAAAPLRVTLSFTPEQFARWEALIEQLRKDGQLDPKEELVLAALETRPRGRVKAPATVIVRRCPDCAAEALVTSRGELPIGPATAASLQEAPTQPAPGGDPPRTLTPALRRKILARDGYRCKGPGCTSTRFLEVHHRTPRARGGANDPANLITLCSACHQLHHERGLALPRTNAAAARGSP
jgi:hypothetical protein